MKMYSVVIPEVYYAYVDIKARSKREAIRKADDLLKAGKLEESLYSHTSNIGEWEAEEI